MKKALAMFQDNMFAGDSFYIATPNGSIDQTQSLFSPFSIKQNNGLLNSPVFDLKFPDLSTTMQSLPEFPVSYYNSPKKEQEIQNPPSNPIIQTNTTPILPLKKSKARKKKMTFKPFSNFDSLELSVSSLNKFSRRE